MRLNLAFKTVAISAEFCVVDDLSSNSCSSRDEKATSLWAVGYYQHDFGGIVFGLRSFYQRRHVGAAAGNKHSDAFAAHGLTEIEEAIIDYALITSFFSYLPESYDRLS